MSHSENKSLVPGSGYQPAQLPPDEFCQIDSSHALNIYHLPDEILSQICSYATAPKAMPMQFNAQQSQPSMATELRTAHALCLVSRRFNHVSTPFLFQSLVFTQTKLTGRSLTQRDLSSRPELQEPHNLKKLFTLLRDKPDLRQHCTSLCLNYKEQPLDDSDNSEGSDEGSSQDGTSDDEHESTEIDNMIPSESLLNYLYGQLTNVRDFQVNVTGYAVETPLFVLALLYMTKLRRLCITGHVHHTGIFNQIAILGPDHRPQHQFETLDMSNTTYPVWDHELFRIQQRGFLNELQTNAGIGPIKRLLTGPDHDIEVLSALVAWPKRLERLALQVDPHITSNSARGDSLQQVLDTQKQFLTHLRIQGRYELGLHDFDLRDFPHLEHLALCDATLANFSQLTLNGKDTPRLDSRIFAPRLRSLLWVLPWWLNDRPKIRDFFSNEHEKRLRLILEMALNIKQQRKNTGEWCFGRVWVQCTVAAPECFEEEARRNFEKDLQRIKALDDEFGPLGINVRHLPLPKPSTDGDGWRDRVFGLLDEVWSWDNDPYTI